MRSFYLGDTTTEVTLCWPHSQAFLLSTTALAEVDSIYGSGGISDSVRHEDIETGLWLTFTCVTIGTSFSEPYTSVMALHMCVCMLACLD